MSEKRGVQRREKSAKRKEAKTKRKREKDNNHMREKREKENKIILNIITYLAYIWHGLID